MMIILTKWWYFPGTDIRVCPTDSISTDNLDALIIAAWVPTEKVLSLLRSRFNVTYAIRLFSPISCVQLQP